MEYLYTVHTKQIDDKTYYFVKKIMALSEFKGLADVVIGYGMHTDFEKACSIAGIEDKECRKKLLLDFEESNNPKKPAEKRTIDIAESVNHWLSKQGAEMLN